MQNLKDKIVVDLPQALSERERDKTAVEAALEAIGFGGNLLKAAELEDLDGNPVELLDFIRGGPALIEFWATWCEQCEALQPQLDQIQKEYGEDLTIVAVAVAVSQSQRRVKRHLEDHDPGYAYLYDARGAAVRAYQAPTTAVVVIVDADGKVVYTGVGPRQDLVGAVQKVLGVT